MKFLLNENIGKLVTDFLRNKGYDVKSAIEDFRGFPDLKILQIAWQEDRILVTLDQDFGRMIYQTKSPHRGVILLRLKKESQEAIIEVLENALEQLKEEDLKGKFSVITEEKIRIR
jgi:predicted nuclease of predicted toxin-antitoxin system